MHTLTSSNSALLPAGLASDASRTSESHRIHLIWLVGVVALLPVRFIDFPLNMDLVDFWSLAGLSVFWLAFVAGRQTIITHMGYTVAMLLIVVASALSMFAAPKPENSVLVVAKEVYLFVWCVTLTVVFTRLTAKDRRVIMSVWLATAVAHGLLIIAQFVWPELWRMTAGLAGKDVPYEFFRPSGLYISATAGGGANQAAFYQLLGFVPLILASPPKRLGALLAIVLLCSLLATGSMGTLIAFTVGVTVTTVAVVAMGKQAYLTRLFAQTVVALAVFGGALVLVGGDRDHQVHLENIFLGRLERSSGGRFDLWQRGLVVANQRGVAMLGVGPENFREMDWMDKQLHNDFLAFLVERGLLGVLGLVSLGAVAVGRAFYLLRIHTRFPGRIGMEVVVFLAATIAILVVSLTHQVFHFRELWIVVALQEALISNSS